MSTRQLCSQLENYRAGAKRKLNVDGLDERSPPRQRPKRPPVLYHCLSCLVDMPSRNFPDHNPSPDCEHLINTCKDCLRGWVNAQIDQNLAVTDGNDNTVFSIKCPECSVGIQTLKLQEAASRKMYEVFVTQKRNHLVETMSGWFWCQNPRCSEGAALKDENEEVFTCAKCGADSCVPCQCSAPSESCKKCKARRVNEDDMSLGTIKVVTKPCPGCGANTEKNGGYDHIQLESVMLIGTGERARLGKR